MKAALYYSARDIRIVDLDRPSPGPGEVLVEMRACGICGSDLLEWYVDGRAPTVLGHEPVGVVVEVGKQVDVPPPALGRRVFVHHHVPCLECELCLRGHETLCETFKQTRIVPGGFSELILVPAANASLDLLELPDCVSDVAATTIEPLACCVRGQRRAGVGHGTRLVVVGAGQIGLLYASAARAAGAHVVIAEVLEQRRGFAEALGFAAVEPNSEHVAAALGGRATVIALCTGAPSAWELALEVVDQGCIVQLFAPGLPDERRVFDVNDFFFRELEVQGSYSAGPRDTRAALELIATGAVDPEALITHRFELERTAEALATARSPEAVKVVVTNGTVT